MLVKQIWAPTTSVDLELCILGNLRKLGHLADWCFAAALESDGLIATEEQIQECLDRLESQGFINCQRGVRLSDNKPAREVSITPDGLANAVLVFAERENRAARLKQAVGILVASGDEYSLGVLLNYLRDQNLAPESSTALLIDLLRLQTTGVIQLRLAETIYVSETSQD